MRRSLATACLLLGLVSLAGAQRIPSGPKLKVRIKDDMETLRRSSEFHCELVEQVAAAGKVVLPRGTALLGERIDTQEESTAELVLIRRPERDYPIVTSSIFLGGTKATEQNQRRRDAMQAAADVVRGAARPQDVSPPSIGNGGEAAQLVPDEVLQFKLRKDVKIDEPPPRKPSR